MSEEASKVPATVPADDEKTTPWQRLTVFAFFAAILILLAITFSAKGWIPLLSSILVITVTHVVFAWNTAPPTAGKETRYSGIFESVRVALPWTRYVLDRQNRGFEVAKGFGKGLGFAAARWLTEHGLHVLLFTVPIAGHQIYVVMTVVLMAVAIFIIMPSAKKFLKPLIADRAPASPATTSKDS